MNHFTTLKNKCRTNFNFNSVLRLFTIFSLLFFLVVLIIFPEICSVSFLDGLVLFTTAVLPSLFPFLFITKMLTDFGVAQKLTNIMQKPFMFLFGTSGQAFYVFLMSILCGYPVGAKILSDMVKENQISKQEAEDMLPFCSSSGPLFIIGTVGFGMFGSKSFGLKLYFVHLLSIITVAFVVCNIKRIFIKQKQTMFKLNTHNKNLDQILAKNMIDTCSSVLLVGGFISFFYLVIDILLKFRILVPLSWLLKVFNLESGTAMGISSGIIEMTRGCKELSIYPSAFSGVAASAIIAFGGLSIVLQSIAFLSQSKISSKKFLFVKTMQTAAAILFSLIFLH